MPRIRDEYLDCVLYLYSSEADADEGARSGGSGFWIGVLAQPFPPYQTWFPYAVMNRHVIEGGATVIRLSTLDGQKRIIPTIEKDWVFHQDGDDLAVYNPNSTELDLRDCKFNFVPRHTLIDKSTIAYLNIGPGDEAFVVGRFINHEGRQRNIPSARFGCIAQMPWEPIPQDRQHGQSPFMQESFLVEARSIGGYSGSPVFVYIPIFSDRTGVEDWYPPNDLTKLVEKEWGNTKAHGPWLLGIDWGHLNDWSPVYNASGRPINPGHPQDMQVKANTGMMTVVPAWKLAEMLDGELFSDKRRQEMETARQKETQSPSAAATLD